MDATSEKVDATSLAAQAGGSSFRRCEKKATKKSQRVCLYDFIPQKQDGARDGAVCQAALKRLATAAKSFLETSLKYKERPDPIGQAVIAFAQISYPYLREEYYNVTHL